MVINARATTFTFGTAGNDIINAQYLLGDLIDGLTGNDTITGLDGSDTLLGGDGRDSIYGLGGHDVLDGGSGNDRLFGGAGNDILRPGTGNDFVDGGDDFDTVDYDTSGAIRGVRVDLRITGAQDTRGAGTDTIRNVESVVGTGFNDTLIGSDADNNIFAGAGSDSLSGGNGNDWLVATGFADFCGDSLNGGNGNDNLTGGFGNDSLSGGADDDRISSSLGADLISGGAGRDKFIFENVADSNAEATDRITDFNGAEDVIILQPLQFATNVDFIGNNAFTSSGISEIRVTSSVGMQLVEVDVGGNGSVDMMIKVAGTALAADDFAFSIFGI